ncbi:MAG: phosphate-starvation-inducible PsiE family protein [Burkholderiales bacterium]|nr:phosphate-starvation-inducible PsiE family protein [Burkholderiales bacterium]
MAKNWISQLNKNFEDLLLIIQAIALVIITLATAFAIVEEAFEMIAKRGIGLANLLLLFLFIEILSMVRQYALGQHELKLKTPLVITVVAVARYLIINMEHLTSKYILLTSIAILILTFALLVSRRVRGLHDEEEEDKLRELELIQKFKDEHIHQFHENLKHVKKDSNPHNEKHVAKVTEPS